MIELSTPRSESAWSSRGAQDIPMAARHARRRFAVMNAEQFDKLLTIGGLYASNVSPQLADNAWRS